MFTNTHSSSVHRVGATHSILLLRNGSTEEVWNELRVAPLAFRGPPSCAPAAAALSDPSVSSAVQAVPLARSTGAISAQLMEDVELMVSLLWRGAVVRPPQICAPQPRPVPLPVHVRLIPRTPLWTWHSEPVTFHRASVKIFLSVCLHSGW